MIAFIETKLHQTGGSHCHLRYGFRIRTAPADQVEKMVTPYVEMGRLFAQKGIFLTPEAKKFTGPEQYPWLLRKMVSLLFLKKVNEEFDHFAKDWGCTRPLDDKPYCG